MKGRMFVDKRGIEAKLVHLEWATAIPMGLNLVPSDEGMLKDLALHTWIDGDAAPLIDVEPGISEMILAEKVKAHLFSRWLSEGSDSRKFAGTAMDVVLLTRAVTDPFERVRLVLQGVDWADHATPLEWGSDDDEDE
jgi:hypothetical protein